MSPEYGLPLSEALAIIENDPTRYEYGFQIGREMSTRTKAEIYEQELGDEARNGRKHTNPNGEVTHIPGYYERYTGLTRAQIDMVLVDCTILLATSTVLTHFGTTVHANLRRAESAQRALARQANGGGRASY